MLTRREPEYKRRATLARPNEQHTEEAVLQRANTCVEAALVSSSLVLVNQALASHMIKYGNRRMECRLRSTLVTRI